MGSIRLLILGLMALAVAGCGPRLAQTPELPQPPQRIVQYGYSFMPPNEPGWHVAGRDGNGIILGRFGPSTDETVAIVAGNATGVRLETRAAFEKYVRQQMVKDAAPNARFGERNSELTMLRYRGANCARVHITAVDHQARRRSGQKGDMTLEMMQLFCRHPDNAGVVTFLGYSQRYTAGHRDPDFDAKAEHLINSLEFSKF
jgi:hypothetical protein